MMRLLIVCLVSVKKKLNPPLLLKFDVLEQLNSYINWFQTSASG